MFHKAYLKGLDAICLTEHFNTLSFLEMYDYIYITIRMWVIVVRAKRDY